MSAKSLVAQCSSLAWSPRFIPVAALVASSEGVTHVSACGRDVADEGVRKSDRVCSGS